MNKTLTLKEARAAIKRVSENYSLAKVGAFAPSDAAYVVKFGGGSSSYASSLEDAVRIAKIRRTSVSSHFA